jgi:hypothetical protein
MQDAGVVVTYRIIISQCILTIMIHCIFNNNKEYWEEITAFHKEDKVNLGILIIDHPRTMAPLSLLQSLISHHKSHAYSLKEG